VQVDVSYRAFRAKVVPFFVYFLRIVANYGGTLVDVPLRGKLQFEGWYHDERLAMFFTDMRTPLSSATASL
jgi:hypothetical protein